MIFGFALSEEETFIEGDPENVDTKHVGSYERGEINDIWGQRLKIQAIQVRLLSFTLQTDKSISALWKHTRYRC